MDELETFISPAYRPEVFGGRLDKDHETIFNLTSEYKNCQEIHINAICFGPRKDNVLINLEHVINKNDEILILYYEDIHKRWSYVNTNSESYFIYKKNFEEQYKIIPNYLYIRGCYIEPDDKFWILIGEFFNFVELWQGKVLCSLKQQLSNESKLYQINNSLKKAARNNPIISVGVSYVIKGKKHLALLDPDKSYIVKSLSGVRSRVVDEQDFSNWSSDNVNNIPVLFQEKINGNDLRVHIINHETFARRSNNKQNIDYRYDDNFFKLSPVANLHELLREYCKDVANKENNQLLGIDFIETGEGYVALEANPSPGWSAYHPFNGIDDEPFITKLIQVLKSDKVY